MNDEEFGSLKLLKLKYRSVDQTIQPFCRIVPPKKLGVPSLICKNFKSEKSTTESCRMQWNLMNDEEFGSLKIETEKGRNVIIQPFCIKGSSQEIRSPLFNFMKFENTEKSAPEPCRMHWNLVNDGEFASLKLSKLKYRRGDKKIQPLCRIGSCQEIRYRLFNLRKF